MPGTALWVDGFVCLPVSPFICLPLSCRLDVSRCLPAWMPGTALWVDGFICLPLSPFICLPAWMPARVHLSPFVSLHLSPVVSSSLDLARLSGWTGSCVSLCPLHLSPVLSQPGCLALLSGWTGSFVSLCLSWFLPLSPSLDAWHGSLGGRVHLSPFLSLHLSPVVSQPGCLARLSGWTGSFVYLCLPGCLAPLCFPSFVSRCLPARMPGTVFLVDRFTFLPLSPFIWLLFSPSLDVCHGSPGGRIHLSPLVALHLSPISVGGRIHLFLSQPGCLARLSGWTDSFVSRCLPAWMCGTHAPRFPSLPAVLSFWRCLVCLRLWPWLRSFLVLWMLGQGPPLFALHLDFDFAWARGGSSSLSIVGYTLSVRSVPRYQLQSRADDSGALRCAASATRRLC